MRLHHARQHRARLGVGRSCCRGERARLLERLLGFGGRGLQQQQLLARRHQLALGGGKAVSELRAFLFERFESLLRLAEVACRAFAIEFEATRLIAVLARRVLECFDHRTRSRAPRIARLLLCGNALFQRLARVVQLLFQRRA